MSARNAEGMRTTYLSMSASSYAHELVVLVVVLVVIDFLPGCLFFAANNLVLSLASLVELAVLLDLLELADLLDLAFAANLFIAKLVDEVPP